MNTKTVNYLKCSFFFLINFLLSIKTGWEIFFWPLFHWRHFYYYEDFLQKLTKANLLQKLQLLCLLLDLNATTCDHMAWEWKRNSIQCCQCTFLPLFSLKTRKQWETFKKYVQENLVNAWHLQLMKVQILKSFTIHGSGECFKNAALKIY